METFLLWWSIISTVLGVIFLLGNVAQYVGVKKQEELNTKEKEIHKAQVKVWQHHAEGIQSQLFATTQSKFSSVDDLRQAIEAQYHNARSLYTSLNEERLFTDEEIKAMQLHKEQKHQERYEHERKIKTSASV